MEKRWQVTDQLSLPCDKVADYSFPRLRLDDAALIEAIVELLRERTASGNSHADDSETDTAEAANEALDNDGMFNGEAEVEDDTSESYPFVENTGCGNKGPKDIPIKISIADSIGFVSSPLSQDVSWQAPSPTYSLLPRAAMDAPARAGLRRSVVQNACGQRIHVTWTIDARKLQTKDNVIVSPSFEIDMVRPIPFRMMLLPREVTDKKGGHCFKKARGAGSVQLKCEADLEDSAFDTTLTFRVSAGGEKQRGPVTHDFARTGVCSLPTKEQLWHFSDFIDATSQTFSIELEA